FNKPSNQLIQEWGIYCGGEEIFELDFDIEKYWLEKARFLPCLSKLALKYIWLPISGVDIERSFSAYKNILSDKRHSLSPESIEILNMLYFNQ
ncbi:55_t:CDS:1, partial [Racocetra persica]